MFPQTAIKHLKNKFEKLFKEIDETISQIDELQHRFDV